MGEAVRRNVATLERRRGHAERLEQALPDDVLVLASGDVRDDPTEDPVPQVRVLEAHVPGVQANVGPGPKQLGEPVEIETLLAIAPRVVGRQPGRHRQQVAHGDRRASPRSGRAGPTSSGTWRPTGIVQAEAAVVAQRQDGGRREALGHRGDPEDAVGVGRRVLADPQRPDAAGVDQLAAEDVTP